MNDGGCDEFINLRQKQGAIRPVGKKEYLHPQPSYAKIYIHRIDDTDNWIGYNTSTKALDHYNKSSLDVTQALITISGTLYEIRSLKNFLIVTTSLETIIFLYNDGSYVQITLTGMENVFNVALTQTSLVQEDTEEGADADALLGKYYKKLNEWSADSKFSGGVTYRIALKLFDGTYILHSVPKVHQFNDYGAWVTLTGGGNYYMTFSAASLSALATFSIVADAGLLDQIKPVVSSIVLFFSQNQQYYDVNEKTFTQDNLDTWIPGAGTYNLSLGVDVSEKFKDIVDSPLWYKVGEINLDNLEDGSVVPAIKEGTIELDIEGFYQNYGTKRTLPIDSFSHHINTGLASYIYNDRLNLGDTKQTLTNPFIELVLPLPDYVLEPLVNGIAYTYSDPADNYEGKVVITIDTANGTKTVVQDLTLYAYKKPANSDFRAVFLNSIIGYYDARATTITVYIKVAGSYYQIYQNNLQSSNYSNYSYIENKEFDTGDVTNYQTPLTAQITYNKNFASIQVEFQLSLLVTPIVIASVANTIVDNNNVQISDVSNPFVFKAANYQPVSDGRIIAFGTNTDPISDSQFGQFPLYIFTSVGIWAMLIGTGAVYIEKVVPVNGEVLIDRDSKADISMGTVYATLEGLKIVSGKKVIEISETVEGLPDQYFIDNTDLQSFLNNDQTVNVSNHVDKVPFKTYLTGALIGYNKSIDNEEIVVSNSAYEYTYIFDLKHKFWYKTTEKYTVLINYYPKLYALRTTSGSEGIVNLSNEIASDVDCYFHTRPLSLGSDEEFKKLRRSFLRGFMNMTSGKFACLYIFGSDDLVTWEFLTGNDRNSGKFNNIWVTHSQDSKRYFIFVFAASISFSPTTLDTHIKSIEIEKHVKWNRKLR